jgi:probable rRNA maturation factor
MFKYKIINSPDFKTDQNIIKTIFDFIQSIEIDNVFNWTLNIVFVDPKTIKKLNNNYRKKDEITDVLSFNYYSEFDSLKDDDIAGELVFCEEKIKLQAIEYGLWEEKEFYKLLIHSILHIIWYDHIDDNDFEIMNKKEKIIWDKIYWK